MFKIWCFYCDSNSLANLHTAPPILIQSMRILKLSNIIRRSFCGTSYAPTHLHAAPNSEESTMYRICHYILLDQGTPRRLGWGWLTPLSIRMILLPRLEFHTYFGDEWSVLFCTFCLSRCIFFLRPKYRDFQRNPTGFQMFRAVHKNASYPKTRQRKQCNWVDE